MAANVVKMASEGFVERYSERGAQVNVIEKVKVDDIELTPTDKTVNITIPALPAPIAPADADADGQYADANKTREELAEKVNNTLVPEGTASNNKLVNQRILNEAIQTSAAHYKGYYDDWAAVPSTASGYPVAADGTQKPGPNDYIAVGDMSDYPVEEGEDRLTGAWRMIYASAWDEAGKGGWNPGFKYNEEPLTPQQQAALDSGINSTKVAKLDGIAAGAQVNSVETVKVNGSALSPDDHKAVNIIVPTKASDIGAQPAGNYKKTQTAVADPSVPSSGTTASLSFIDTISQDANGVITPTKKNVATSAPGTTNAYKGKVADAYETGTALAGKAGLAANNTFTGSNTFNGSEEHNGAVNFLKVPTLKSNNTDRMAAAFPVYVDTSGSYYLVPHVTVQDDNTATTLVDSYDITSAYVRDLLSRGGIGFPSNWYVRIELNCTNVNLEPVDYIPIWYYDAIAGEYVDGYVNPNIYIEASSGGTWSNWVIYFSSGGGLYPGSLNFQFDLLDAGYNVVGYYYAGFDLTQDDYPTYSPPSADDSNGYHAVCNYSYSYFNDGFSSLVSTFGWMDLSTAGTGYVPTSNTRVASEFGVAAAEARINNTLSSYPKYSDLQSYVPRSLTASTSRTGIVQLSTDYKSGDNDKAVTTGATRSMYESISSIMGLMNYPRLHYKVLHWGTGINGFFIEISNVPLHGVFRLDVNSGSTAASLKFSLKAGPSAPAENGTIWGESICTRIQREGRFSDSGYYLFDDQSRWAVFYLNIAADAPHSDYTMSFGTGTYAASWREYTVVSDYDGANPMTFSHAQGQQAKYIVRLLEVDTDVFYLSRSELH